MPSGLADAVKAFGLGQSDFKAPPDWKLDLQNQLINSMVAQGYNAFEFNVNARLGRGARLFGGSATDRTIANTCAAAATNPNFLMTIGGVNYCDQSNSGIPWRTQWKVAGTYPLPWYAIVLSGSVRGSVLLRPGSAP